MAYLIKYNETNHRRQRRAKLGRLRVKFTLAENDDVKNAILDKVGKIAPWLSRAEFLAPTEEKS